MARGAEIDTLGSFFRLVEMPASDAHRRPATMNQIRAGALHGAILYDVYSPEVLNRVVERLERHDPPFLKTWFPVQFNSWFYGRNLNLTGADLSDYFREAAEFHGHLRELFPDDLELTSRLGGLLSELDGGRPYAAAPGPGPGEKYMFTTVRAHMEGGYIPPHFDNEQALRPSYAHLRTLVEPHILSFVVALTMAEGGGALEVYDFELEPQAASLINDDEIVDKPEVNDLDSVTFRLPPGSMIILDSGRYLHRLSPIEGSRKRWTMCSFMALSRLKDAVYCWG